MNSSFLLGLVTFGYLFSALAYLLLLVWRSVITIHLGQVELIGMMD